jgi:hypothetical protein
VGGSEEASITTLPEQVVALPGAMREQFESLFQVTRSRGSLVPPPEMRSWIAQAFGSVDAVRNQAVIKTLNRWTLEGALFNALRARRPIAGRAGGDDGTALTGEGSDPFCRPLIGTPADTFGRVEGAHAITASNVAKYDGLHAVIIFKQHNPLEWTAAQLNDVFTTAARWLETAVQAQPQAVYPFIMWNCLTRSGASQIHAHMQATLSEEVPYARVELWRRAAAAYRQQHGRDYFATLYAVHEALGLAFTGGPVRRLAHLTPLKEKEVLFLAPALDNTLYEVIYTVLRQFIDHLGVRAFNLALYLPPLAPVAEDWTGFPVIGRLVDRGDPTRTTSDIGAMELFAQPVVASDPWWLADVLRNM